MFASYVIGIATIVIISVGWVVVQQWWRSAFLDVAPHPDPLAARGSCHDCSLPEACDVKRVCHTNKESS